MPVFPGTYEEGRQKLRRAEVTSDLQTEAEEEGDENAYPSRK